MMTTEETKKQTQDFLQQIKSYIFDDDKIVKIGPNKFIWKICFLKRYKSLSGIKSYM